MMETTDPSLDTIYSPNLPAVKLHHFYGRKWRFGRVPTATTTMMEGSFEGAASGPIVLDTMVETNKPLLDTVHWFSQSQYNFTT